MKKILLPGLMMVFLVNSGQAQSYGGFKGGLNICSFTGQGEINGASSLASGNFGLFENIPVAGKLSIQPEPTISWEGETYNQPQTFNSGSYKFHYMNLPVLMHIKFAGDVYGETGPQAGYLLSARRINILRDPGGPPVTTHTDYRRMVRKINYGWDFGVGYSLSKMLSLSVRYNMGLSNLGQAHQGMYRNSVCSFNAYFSPNFKESEAKVRLE